MSDYHEEMTRGVPWEQLSSHCSMDRHGELCDDRYFWPAEMTERSCKCHCHDGEPLPGTTSEPSKEP